MSNTHGFSVTRPISVWNKPLKIDFKDFFKALGKLTADGISQKWLNASKDVVDMVSAVSFKNDCGQVAWVLIYKSLTQAIFALVDENKDMFTKVPENFDVLCEKLDLSLENNDLRIDKNFFIKPGELPVIDMIKQPFVSWLLFFGPNSSEANAIGARLSSYFVFALHEEWSRNPDTYTSLKEKLETPFTRADEWERAWIRYSAWLEKQVDERMFFEAFGLRQVYILPRAYYKQKKEKEESDRHDRYFETSEKVEYEQIVVELYQELDRWLETSDTQDAIRIISGGPGSGKSSFTKMFAALQARKGSTKILFIPLYHFDLLDDLIDAVRSFIRADGFLPHNPLEPEYRVPRLLIIFDGLDELSKQGKVAAEAAQQFVREVQKKVDQFNMREMCLHVLITGRPLVVQENESEFRKPHQILTILPYYLPDNEKGKYTDTDNRLEKDQRQLWWQLYGSARGSEYSGMPDKLGRIELEEITSQPLLNYLVALSFTRGKLNFTQETYLNCIYDDLLKEVYERSWDVPHPALQGISENEFIRVLEEIALTAWHGKGRTTTLKDIEAYCSRSGLTAILEKFQSGVRIGISRLLIAFYFRQSGFAGEKTFEFTHKSFGEYLIARRIVRGIKKMNDELERRRDDFDSGWDEKEALKY